MINGLVSIPLSYGLIQYHQVIGDHDVSTRMSVTLTVTVARENAST